MYDFIASIVTILCSIQEALTSASAYGFGDNNLYNPAGAIYGAYGLMLVLFTFSFHCSIFIFIHHSSERNLKSNRNRFCNVHLLRK